MFKLWTLGSTPSKPNNHWIDIGFFRAGVAKKSNAKPPVSVLWLTRLGNRKRFVCYKTAPKPTIPPPNPSVLSISTIWSRWVYDQVSHLECRSRGNDSNRCVCVCLSFSPFRLRRSRDRVTSTRGKAMRHLMIYFSRSSSAALTRYQHLSTILQLIGNVTTLLIARQRHEKKKSSPSLSFTR